MCIRDRNIIMKPTNSPTQGQPNPRKIRLKVGIWAIFSPHQIVFRGLRSVSYRKQTATNLTQPNSPQTAYFSPKVDPILKLRIHERQICKLHPFFRTKVQKYTSWDKTRWYFGHVFHKPSSASQPRMSVFFSFVLFSPGKMNAVPEGPKRQSTKRPIIWAKKQQNNKAEVVNAPTGAHRTQCAIFFSHIYL